MNKDKEIETLRKGVDKIDYKLVFLLAARLKITKKIISLKKENELSVKDGNRELTILKKANGLAKKLKISPKFVEGIFKKIMKESKT